LESCFPPLNIAPPGSFAPETPEVGQTLTSTYKTHNAGCMYGDKITFIQSCPYTYITFIVILSHNKPWWAATYITYTCISMSRYLLS
jgi:hypothetical protein